MKLPITFNALEMVNGRALAYQIKDAQENFTAGGIALPNKKPREFKSVAIVLHTGGKFITASGVEIPFPAATGDIVFLRDGFGIEPISILGEDFKVLEPSAVVGRIYTGYKVCATDTSITVVDTDGNTVLTIGY